MDSQKRKPFALLILWILLFFLTVGGLFGGIFLVIDPSGSFMHFPGGIVEKTFFHSLLVPGIILFILNGVIPGLALAGMIGRFSCKPAEALNIYKDVHWSWTFSLYCGIILMIWINVQIMVLGYLHTIQMVYSFYGMAVLILTLMPGVKGYFGSSPG